MANKNDKKPKTADFHKMFITLRKSANKTMEIEFYKYKFVTEWFKDSIAFINPNYEPKDL